MWENLIKRITKTPKLKYPTFFGIQTSKNDSSGFRKTDTNRKKDVPHWALVAPARIRFPSHMSHAVILI